MIKEPIITELSDGSLLVSFEGLSDEELRLFAGIGMLSVLKDSVKAFEDDVKTARRLAKKARVAINKKVSANKPPKKARTNRITKKERGK